MTCVCGPVFELAFFSDGARQMMLCNHTSRYHVAAAAVRGGALRNPRVAVDAHALASFFMHLAQKDREYILQNGKGACTLIFLALC